LRFKKQNRKNYKKLFNLKERNNIEILNKIIKLFITCKLKLFEIKYDIIKIIRK